MKLGVISYAALTLPCAIANLEVDNTPGGKELVHAINIGNVVGDQVIGKSGSRINVIDKSDFSDALSSDTVNSFNDNSINFYSNDDGYYFAKTCGSCHVVKVDRGCNCYITQDCSTCATALKPVTYSTTAPLATSVAFSTHTASPVVHVSGVVVFNQCPSGQCFVAADSSAPFRNSTTPAHSGGPTASDGIPSPTSSIDENFPHPIVPSKPVPKQSLTAYPIAMDYSVLTNRIVIVSYRFDSSGPIFGVPVLGLAVAFGVALLL
ncbi:MAG: hypothetical protein M1813_007103 [Trichoglossum hirsutum]|nr:MAG: hypothetical protein M1813_007103 [Trichoglossum hirsutum]